MANTSHVVHIKLFIIYKNHFSFQSQIEEDSDDVEAESSSAMLHQIAIESQRLSHTRQSQGSPSIPPVSQEPSNSMTEPEEDIMAILTKQSRILG